jgi:predicted ribosomally synthesized peptide with SipW-like signal peptide
MSDKPIQLSRRKALAALGTIGVASAGAGLGTTAYFSDREDFENNVLTAGALDLTVDWEEHYSDWSPDEEQGLQNPVEMSDPGNTSYVPFPTPIEPVVWIHENDIDQFMDNTTLESYPDADNNRVQDDLAEYNACEDFAQLDENLNPDVGRGAGVRSANMDTILNYSDYLDGVAPDVAPLVNLTDVKPGDFGELTLSMHVCDNPGYIWFQTELVSADENGVTEPEAKDEHEDQDQAGNLKNPDPNAPGPTVELLDEIQTMLWYDEDGDNVYEPGGQADDTDVVLVIDDSGSMGNPDPNSGSKLANAKAGARFFVDAVGGATNIGVVSFDGSANTDLGLTTKSGNEAAIKAAIDGISGGGGTNIEAGIETGQSLLGTGSSSNKILILLSDGEPTTGTGTDGNISPVGEAQIAKNAGTTIFTIGYGISSGSSFAQTLRDVASDPDDTYAYLDVDVDTEQEVQAVFGQIGEIIVGEECFFQGTLRELLALGTPEPANGKYGIPLDGVRTTEYDEVTGNDTTGDGFVDSNYGVGAGDDPNRECFVDCTTNALGLAWWLPVNHANEIQTDSVTFNLGFYTEQCRHNSGAGQA